MITQSEYAKRRERFFEMMEENSLAVLPAAPQYLRNNDAEYPFRQNSDFFYLTGFNEPHAIAVLDKNAKENRFILFCLDHDPAVEQWVGYRCGPKRAPAKFGADEAYVIDETDQYLPELMLRKKRIYYPFARYQSFDQQMMNWLNEVRSQLRSGINMPSEIVDLESITHEMRLIKSDEEIAAIQHACDVNVVAFQKMISVCAPEKMEYELAAELEYYYRKNGSQELAFETIVGSGENATILHYVENSKKIVDGELVLVDAGCVINGYPSDITRTIPANGVFSKEQRDIYELVLAMQAAGLEKMKPGCTYQEPHLAAIRVGVEGLCRLGILSGNVDKLIEEEAYRPFYMHKFGHWMGLDDHDPSAYNVNGKWRLFQPGMVISAEPGIYIKAGMPGVDKKWWNIGVRIEDDVLITKNGYHILTAALPKTTDEIERLMGKKQ